VKPGLEIRDYGRRGSAALTMRHPLYQQKLALTSPTSGCHSIGIVPLRTKVTELVVGCDNGSTKISGITETSQFSRSTGYVLSVCEAQQFSCHTALALQSVPSSRGAIPPQHLPIIYIPLRLLIELRGRVMTVVELGLLLLVSGFVWALAE
jgi:hypothetical protein